MNAEDDMLNLSVSENMVGNLERFGVFNNRLDEDIRRQLAEKITERFELGDAVLLARFCQHDVIDVGCDFFQKCQVERMLG